MALYRDTGVVLRVQKLAADRIVTLLTRRHGKIRAVAKGVRRTRSRWGARLEPFNHVDVQCYTGRSLDVVTQAQTVDAFGAGLIGDYPRFTAGCAVLETADRLVAEEGEPALRVYLLVVGAVRALAGRERDPSLVSTRSCSARCPTRMGAGDHRLRALRRAGPHGAFSVAAGGAVCPHVGRPARSPPRRRRTRCSKRSCTAMAPPPTRRPPTRREASGLVAAHLQWHMERPAPVAAAGGAAGSRGAVSETPRPPGAARASTITRQSRHRPMNSSTARAEPASTGKKPSPGASIMSDAVARLHRPDDHRQRGRETMPINRIDRGGRRRGCLYASAEDFRPGRRCASATGLVAVGPRTPIGSGPPFRPVILKSGHRTELLVTLVTSVTMVKSWRAFTSSSIRITNGTAAGVVGLDVLSCGRMTSPDLR